MLELDFECQNAIFSLNSNVKIGFRMSKCNIRPDLNDKIGFRMSKCDIRSEFECQARISNVYLVYIYHVFTSG